MFTAIPPARLFTVATLTPVVLIGLAAVVGGWWVAVSLIYLTIFSASMDTLVKRVTPAVDASEFPAADRLCIVLGIAHFVLLILVVVTLAHGGGGFASKLGLFIAAGFFFGQVSNSNAHELIHRGGRGLHRLGMWIYISLLFGHHTSAHVLIHHRYVATRDDPSTSRLGESYYRFLIRAWKGSFVKGFAAESARNAHRGGRFYQHPYFTYIVGAFAFILLAFAVGGPKAAVLYILLAGFATSQLLLSDYVQHYGLLRRAIDGKPEPVGPRHSWNSPHFLSSAVMLNAPRHSAHHAHPSHTYPTLDLPKAGPMLPRSLPAMATLALFPRRWRKVMDPLSAQVQDHD